MPVRAAVAPRKARLQHADAAVKCRAKRVSACEAAAFSAISEIRKRGAEPATNQRTENQEPNHIFSHACLSALIFQLFLQSVAFAFIFFSPLTCPHIRAWPFRFLILLPLILPADVFPCLAMPPVTIIFGCHFALLLSFVPPAFHRRFFDADAMPPLPFSLHVFAAAPLFSFIFG